MERREEKHAVETRVQKRARRQQIQLIVLQTIRAMTLLGTMAVAPNSVQLVKYLEKVITLGTKGTLDRRIAQAVVRLEERGLLLRESDEKGFRMRLTDKGSRLAESLESKMAVSRKPLRWDGKWRVVIFDVWERRRRVRNQLRRLLKRIGFVKVQNSVWVYPYDCEELFVFIRTHLKLGKGVIYIVAEEIERDDRLRKLFALRAARQ